MKKILIYPSGFIFITFAIAVAILGYPIIINFSDNAKILPKISYDAGHQLNPFDKFNFDEGHWEAYIFISKSDMKELNPQIPRYKALKTIDIATLKEMQRNWLFIYTGGDMATTESLFILCKDGKKVYESGIVLDSNHPGLQSSGFGWLEGSQQMITTCKKFKKIYSPFVLIN